MDLIAEHTAYTLYTLYIYIGKSRNMKKHVDDTGIPKVFFATKH